MVRLLSYLGVASEFLFSFEYDGCFVLDLALLDDLWLECVYGKVGAGEKDEDSTDCFEEPEVKAEQDDTDDETNEVCFD